MSKIGNIGDYKVGEDIEIYCERLEQYIVANETKEEQKVAVLLTTIGQHAYKVLRDLCEPDLPKSKSYSNLCDMLKSQFAPQVPVLRKRITFFNLRQENDESVNKWYLKIRNAAAQCQFGTQLEDKIKDKFISGMRPGQILNRLCEEDHNKKLSEYLEIALRKEALMSQNKVMEVQAVQLRRSGGEPKKENYPEQKKNGGKITCFACGEGDHNFRDCKYRKYKCKICSKIGHLAKVCIKKKQHFSNKKNKNCYVEVDNKTVELESNVDVNEMFLLESVNYIQPIVVEASIENVPLEMMIDTGSGLSIIPSNIYYKYFQQFNLTNSGIELKTYNNQIIESLGEILVNVNIQGVSKNCKLLVVKGGSRILLGRDLIKEFRLKLDELGNKCDQVNKLGLTVKESEKQEDLKQLISEFKDIFENKLGKYNFKKIELETKGNMKPIFLKPRRVPFALKEKVEIELDSLEKLGVISKAKNNEFGTPLVPVLKPNGKIRLCGDYKVTINKYLEDFNYPLPTITTLFAALQGGKEFTKLDFLTAYNQLEVTEETKKLLAWSTHKGVYLVNRLPYGTKPACQIFQSIVENCLQGIDGVVNFVDDIVVTGKDREEHLKNLKLVFQRLKDAGFVLNLEKCSFFAKEIKYLGFIINAEGITKDPDKITAVLNSPRPKDVSQIRAFIGMINYYGNFINNLAELLSPLYKLLQKNVKFNWSRDCEESFQKAKEAVASDKVLIHYNPELPLKLACDSSSTGIGCVLLHELPDGSEKPIAFASRVLTKTERGYSMIHKEALAIYWGARKFYQYLMGRKWMLVSDHKPLLALFGEKKGIPEMAAGRLQRWALFLSGFDYVFKHVKGKLNAGPDGLSRLALDIEDNADIEDIEYVNFVQEAIPLEWHQIRAETRRDTELSKIYLYIQQGWPKAVEPELNAYYNRRNELSIESGTVMWGYRLVIPAKFRKFLLTELHYSHLGMTKMKSLARNYFWWPSLDAEIEAFVKRCDACMMVRQEPEKAKLILWEETSRVYERIHIDFLGPFKGKTYLIIIDAFSKWPEVFEMNHITTEWTIEKLRETFARFGIPEIIVSDNGTQFTSSKFSEFCKINGIQHLTSPPFNPSTNGLAENFVKSLKNGIQKACNDKKNKDITLSTIISRYLLAYRTTAHSTTGETPSNLMFKREIRTRLDLIRNNTREKAQARQKNNYKGNRQLKLEEGDVIFARDYRNINKKTWEKGVVEQVIGNQNYIIRTLKENLLWRRHLNQLLKGIEIDENQEKDEEGIDKYREENKDATISAGYGRKETEIKIGENTEKEEGQLNNRLPEIDSRNKTKDITEKPSDTIDEERSMKNEVEEKQEQLRDRAKKEENKQETEGIRKMSTSNNPKIERPKRTIKPPDRLNL